ncbi:MAG: hypothetical protein SFY66_21025 [Oculatellaceae cyanobacterium bins.114]|nr:hypothetical protein [Oculatellaceae cyanobacterium bins.114]
MVVNSSSISSRAIVERSRRDTLKRPKPPFRLQQLHGCLSPMIECSSSDEILKHLRSGRLLMVNSRRRNGLILYKQFHAEFAGPGAAVGGFFDEDCQQVIPVGNLSLLVPDSHEERQKAYLIRRQWIRLTQQFTDNSVPLQRAQMILNQFENYFDANTIAGLPDESFAMLVGVLPQTVRMARRPPLGQMHVKVKA